MRKIALQLYTVREALKKDFVGTLAQVARMGYTGVELAGDMGGHSAGELRRILDDLGIRVISGHVGMDALGGGLDRLLEDYAMLGAGYVGVAWMPESYRSETGWLRAGKLMEQAALQARKHGLVFHYHNHAFEFERLPNGKYAFDQLFDNTDPALLKSQLDVYWVKKGGEDPVAYIKKLSGRVPLIHLKDMSADPSHTFEIVGEGILDCDAIFAAGDASGVDWYIVEQDKCPKGELESARRSYQNIVARGWLG